MLTQTVHNKTTEAINSHIPQTYLEAQAIALLLYARKEPVFKKALVKMTKSLHPLTNGTPRFAVTSSVGLLMPEDYTSAIKRATMLLDMLHDKSLEGAGAAIEILASASRE